MIQTWIADVTPLLEEETYRKYYEVLPDWRKEKADRIHFPIDKALSVGAWTLYEKMKDTYQLSDEASFNLSHSGNYAMCSVEDTESTDVKVGCDIEKVKKTNMKIAKRFFCEAECELVQKDEGYFFRLWVLKESFMKVTRLGMKLALDTFEFEFAEGNVPILKRKPDNIAGEYFFREYKKEGLPYKMAVSSTTELFAEEVQEVNL